MSGGKAPSVTTTPQYPGFNDAMNTMGNEANQVAGTLGQPYGGQLVAGFSPTQQTAQDYLNAYVNSGNAQPYTSDPMYQNAYSALNDTVSGKYVTPNSPFTQGMSQYYNNQVLPGMEAQLNQQAARMGNLSGSAYENMNTTMLNQAQDYLASLGAQNYSTERQNQLNAIPQAESMAQLTQNSPYALYNQLMSAGSASQELEQNQLTDAYNEFMRQRQEQLQPLSLAPQASQMMNYSYDPGEQSFFQQYIQPLASSLSNLKLGNLFGTQGTSSIDSSGLTGTSNYGSTGMPGFDWRSNNYSGVGSGGLTGGDISAGGFDWNSISGVGTGLASSGQ